MIKPYIADIFNNIKDYMTIKLTLNLCSPNNTSSTNSHITTTFFMNTPSAVNNAGSGSASASASTTNPGTVAAPARGEQKTKSMMNHRGF